MALDIKLLDIIACPVCKGKLHYQAHAEGPQELICRFDRLAYPLEEGSRCCWRTGPVTWRWKS